LQTEGHALLTDRRGWLPPRCLGGLEDRVDVARPLPARPRFSRSIDFAALPTALTCTRLFIASTLHLWNAQHLHTDTELLAVALVRHSLHTCGVVDKGVRLHQLDHLNTIHLRLLGYDQAITIEVWDTMTEPAESTGLSLIEARATDWGSAITPRGRVTWAELAAYEHTRAGLPRRPRTPPPQPRPTTTWPMPAHNLDFLARVRNGIAGL
jgi:hypothetical protein